MVNKLEAAINEISEQLFVLDKAYIKYKSQNYITFTYGSASFLQRLSLKKTLMESGIFAKLGALLMKPALLRMKKQMDASEYGGALLMGVRAPFIICHGSSKAKAIKNAVRVAIELTQKDVVGRIRQEIMHDEESGEL